MKMVLMNTIYEGEQYSHPGRVHQKKPSSISALALRPNLAEVGTLSKEQAEFIPYPHPKISHFSDLQHDYIPLRRGRRHFHAARC